MRTDMYTRKKWFFLVSLVVALVTLFTACQPETIVETVVVTVEQEGEIVEVVVTATPSPDEGEPAGEEAPEGPIPAEGLVPCLPLPDMAMGGGKSPGVASAAPPEVANPIDYTPHDLVAPESIPAQQEGKIYRVGVFEDLTTTNYWAANGPDNTVWNAYMLPQRLSMYQTSAQRLDFVPMVAKDVPEPLVQEGDYWVVEIPIWDTIAWSDGEPFTAEDVAFTANAVMKLGLISGNWQSWYDSNYLDHLEAVEDYVVKYYYHTKPGLARHEWGVLQAPILAEHFWAPLVDEAAAPIDALPEDASDEELLAAQAEAHDNLFAIEPEGEPLAGAFLFTRWEPGAFTEVGSNPDYYQTGAVITEYANGAYQESLANVYDFTLYGNAEGDVSLEYQVGPFTEAAIYTIYSSQDAAVLALKAGEVDMLLNSLGLQRGLLDQVQGDENLEVLQNPVNGFRYMAFNHRRQPMNDCSFRQAVAFLIDKEFVANTILQRVAFPLYSFVPEANGAWYYGDVPKLGLHEDGTPMSREERISIAVEILENAGYTWENDQKPYWDTDLGEVIPGGRLVMPDGTPVPSLELWAPSASYDPLRSTFAIWIESWLNEAGIPVTAKLANFNTLIPRIFTEQDFDMYILGWSLDVYPSSLNDFFTSEQAVPDGNNAAGYMNPEFDELGASFLTCDSYEACKDIANEIQTMLATEVPYVLLFDTGIIEPYRSASVEFPYTRHLSGLQYNHTSGNTQVPLQSAVRVR